MKLSYRARIALLALLLALSTLFASCDLLVGNNAVTTSTQETTTPGTTPNETTANDPSSDEIVPDVTTSELVTPQPEVTTSEPTVTTTEPEVTTTEPKVTTTEPEVTTTEPEVTTPEETTSKPDVTIPEPEGTTSTPAEEGIPEEFKELNIPAYSGSKYSKVNGNVPYFTNADYTTKSYESYAVLDSLGRCGIAMACLGRDLMPTGSRGDIYDVKPSGWVQASYDIVDGRYLYNRSHLIGWQLSGEDANNKNLITGTRSFNQLGMLPFENMVADYIKETNNHVLYRVTPVFVGNELVARGVLMEAWSVEDNGDGICFNVFVYNVQPGIIINYATGSSRLEKEDTTTPEETPACNYIAKKSSKKFHYPNCSSVSKMSDKNKEDHTATHDEMIKKGYSPCGICNP